MWSRQSFLRGASYKADSPLRVKGKIRKGRDIQELYLSYQNHILSIWWLLIMLYPVDQKSSCICFPLQIIYNLLHSARLGIWSSESCSYLLILFFPNVHVILTFWKMRCWLCSSLKNCVYSWSSLGYTFYSPPHLSCAIMTLTLHVIPLMYKRHTNICRPEPASPLTTITLVYIPY